MVAPLICLTVLILGYWVFLAWGRHMKLKEARHQHELHVFSYGQKQYEEQMEHRRMELHIHCIKNGLPTPSVVQESLRKKAEEELS
jgi:hypothetical protein